MFAITDPEIAVVLIYAVFMVAAACAAWLFYMHEAGYDQIPVTRRLMHEVVSVLIDLEKSNPIHGFKFRGEGATWGTKWGNITFERKHATLILAIETRVPKARMLIEEWDIPVGNYNGYSGKPQVEPNWAASHIRSLVRKYQAIPQEDLYPKMVNALATGQASRP